MQPTRSSRALLTSSALLLAGGGSGVSAGLAQSTPAATKAQLLTRQPVASTGWWATATFYQAFVRSFQDSNGDGIGDLKGLTSRLDDLKRLGVNALWLLPIYPSPRFHGYEVTNFQDVNPDYGNLADFSTFLKTAHAKGFRVILDWIPHSTSHFHPWFKEALNPKSPKRDWYQWRSDNPGWGEPWLGGVMGNVWHSAGEEYYYGLFGASSPELNWRNPEVKAAMNDAAAFWLKQGIDGFRVDAIRYLLHAKDDNTPDNPDNLGWVRDFEKFVKGINPSAAVVGEAWTKTPIVAKYLLDGEGEDMAFDFMLHYALLDALSSGNVRPLQAALDLVTASYPPGSVDAIFTTNHDLPRPDFGGTRQAKTAASLLLTLPGTPFIYYGQEIGLPSGPFKVDESEMTPMRWNGSPGAGFTTGKPWHAFSTDAPSISVEAEQKDPSSLLTVVRKVFDK